MSDEEFISVEDMNTITNAKIKAQVTLLNAQKVAAEAKVAELEYQNLVLQVFDRYDLKADDKIDDQTRKIIRAAKPESKPEIKSRKGKKSVSPTAEEENGVSE